MVLTHYIVVRRDLPFGVILAQVAHAAGESFYRLAPGSSKAEQQTSSLQVAGSNPALESTFKADETIAVVLGARNLGKLARLHLQLIMAKVPHVAIREVDGEYATQIMAVGLEPGDKETLAPYVKDFHMFTQLEA